MIYPYEKRIQFIKKRFLERLSIVSAVDYFDQDHVDVDVVYDTMKQSMLARMAWMSWCEKMPIAYLPLSEPASWWQKFKADVLPKWFKKMSPVKRTERKIKLNILALYPDFKPATEGKTCFVIENASILNERNRKSRNCGTCKYWPVNTKETPCIFCHNFLNSRWEPNENNSARIQKPVLQAEVTTEKGSV